MLKLAAACAPSLRPVLSRGALVGSCRPYRTRGYLTASREEASEARAKLNQFLYKAVPAPTVEEEAAKGNVPSDADLPVPAAHPGLAITMQGHAQYRWFKNPLYSVCAGSGG